MNLSKLRAVFASDRRFNRDVIWNIASLAVLGVSGVVINVVIARDPNYGKDALGVFNQVFAFYIVLAQIAVGGVHLSALKHISHNHDDRTKCAAIASSALLLATGLALVVCVGVYLARDLAGAVWKSPAVGTGIALIAPGVLLFSVNKVLICIINGMRHMRAYAIFQGLRFILIVLSLYGLIRLEYASEYLAAALTFAEAILFAALMIYVNCRVVAIWPAYLTRQWIREHFNFGMRGCLSGALTEMNTRVDVLMLGYFLISDSVVGLYSFAAIPAEALGQLALVVRRNVDPVLGACFAKGDIKEINAFARRVKRKVYVSMAVVGLLAVGAYPLAVRLAVPESDFDKTWPIFAILTLGIVLKSGYNSFYGVLLQGGRPGTHTLFVLCVVACNIILNATLIPLIGVYGAAIATALVFVLEAIFIAWFAKRLFNISL